MRTALAIAVSACVSAVLATSAGADPSSHKDRRDPKPPYYYRQPSAQEVCEERARAEDPTGNYAGYPCWAREAFGRGSQGGPAGRR
jgi:hypothetical protein